MKFKQFLFSLLMGLSPLLLPQDVRAQCFGVPGGAPVRYEGSTEAKASSNVTNITVQIPCGTNAGDLLIAVVATDGNTAGSLAPPAGNGWTLINVGRRGNNVTLGVWRKLAGVAEPATHQFIWTGGQEAYAWIMRFTGHDPANPIDAFAAAGQGNSSNPSSPSVTSTVTNAMILRLGAFDDDDIVIDNPGLLAHNPITMDESGPGGGTVSGGAGYVGQPAIGPSGASNFTLTNNEQSRKVTVAIRPLPVPNTTQTGYAWSDDLATFTTKGDNTPLFFQTGNVYIVAIQIAMLNTVANGNWTLQAREDGAGPWLDVLNLGAGQSPVWQTYNIHNYAYANGAVVPVANFGHGTPPGGFSPVDGEFSNDNNSLTDGYSGTNIYTELHYAIRAEPGAAGHNYEFRVDYQGSPLDGGYNLLALAIEPSYGVGVTPVTANTSRLPSNGTNYSVDFTVANSGNVTDDFDLLTRQNPGTAITVVSITGTGVTQGANPDSAQLANLPAGNSTAVTVTYSAGNVAEGTLDTLFFAARSVGNPTVSDVGRLDLNVIRPNLTTTKTVTPFGTQAPGTDLTYTVTLTNAGSEAAVNVVTVDSLPPEVQFEVGSVVNTLPPGVGVTVEYSNDGGSSWTYSPVSAGCGAPASYDACVTHIRWSLLNDLQFTAPDNVGTFDFTAQIK